MIEVKTYDSLVPSVTKDSDICKEIPSISSSSRKKTAGTDCSAIIILAGRIDARQPTVGRNEYSAIIRACGVPHYSCAGRFTLWQMFCSACGALLKSLVGLWRILLLNAQRFLNKADKSPIAGVCLSPPLIEIYPNRCIRLWQVSNGIPSFRVLLE